MADNKAYWDDFYASIYGPAETAPTVTRSSPQVAFKYGLAGDEPPISDMARIGSRNSLGSAPRLAANVGTPAGVGIPKRQVFALGAGLSPQVNALGYRVTDPVVPAVGAIQTAAPATVRPMQPVQAQRGIARAPVPSWIAGMAPKAAPAVVAPVPVPRLTPAQTYAAANSRTAVQDDAAYRVNGRGSGGGGARSLMD